MKPMRSSRLKTFPQIMHILHFACEKMSPQYAMNGCVPVWVSLPYIIHRRVLLIYMFNARQYIQIFH